MHISGLLDSLLSIGLLDDGCGLGVGLLKMEDCDWIAGIGLFSIPRNDSMRIYLKDLFDGGYKANGPSCNHRA